MLLTVLRPSRLSLGLLRLMIPSNSAPRRSARLSAQHSVSENLASLAEPPSKDLSPLLAKPAHSKRRRIHARAANPEASPLEESLAQQSVDRGRGREEEDADFCVEAEMHSPSACREIAPRKALARVKSAPDRSLEQKYWSKGFKSVAGVDEAGRGPLAGPVVAAACIIPPHVDVPGVNDSKKLTVKKREEIYDMLTRHPEVAWAVSTVSPEEIDAINILQATLKAMEQAVNSLPNHAPDFILVDGTQRPSGIEADRCETVVKGDAKCVSIAAASILAKVTRDKLMDEYDKQYPQYSLAQHKGYGTKLHVEAIRKHGLCPIHRKSFKLKKAS